MLIWWTFSWMFKEDQLYSRKCINRRTDNEVPEKTLPGSVKTLQRYLGFVNFYKQNIPRLANKTLPLQLPLQIDVPCKLTQQRKEAITEIFEYLFKASKLSLKLHLPEKQIVIMCDASKHEAGCVLLIEDSIDKETRETNKLAPVCFGSKNFTTGQRSLTMYAKEVLAMHLASDKLGHILCWTKNLSLSRLMIKR